MAYEVERLQLQRFNAVLHDRPMYRESGFTGSPVHFANASREPVAKACAELDGFLDEIEQVLGVGADHRMQTLCATRRMRNGARSGRCS